MKQSLHLGLIGLGGRGSFLLENLLLSMDDVEIAAVCDLYEDRREHAAEVVREGRGRPCKAYADYRLLLEEPGLDGVLIASSWRDHAAMAAAAR